MAVMFRAFQARPGRVVELLDYLCSAASLMVRCLSAERVVICRQTDDHEHVVWLGDRGQDSDFERLRLRKALSDHELIEASTPRSLEFLDEFYHFPPAPYQVWNLEVRVTREDRLRTLQMLFELSRRVRRDLHVVGMSVYQTDNPCAFIGFVSLTSGFSPKKLNWNGLERTGSTVVWRPLSIACEVERLPSSGVVSPAETCVSFAPFWARSGVFPKLSVTPVDSDAPVQPPPVDHT